MYKVVVVEDEEIARKGIIFTINWEALNCMIAGEAANGEEGAAVIRRLSPDIIVTDLKMPRMDGVEMIQMLRCEGNRAKFIILTAYGDFKYAQSAVKLGVSDYLLKPLKDGDLEQAVTRIIAQLEERDQIRQKEEEETPVFRFNAGRKAKNKYVEQAIKYICEHYKEDINISTVAEQLQISEGYLSRVFKKETDYTFTTYLSHYRMKVAMELLKEGKLKVYEVADSVGYSDTAYFSAQFKKVVGIAPSEYQERSGDTDYTVFVLSESFLHLPLRPIFRQLHPNFRGGRNANASEILGTIDKKSSRKIKYKKIPRVHCFAPGKKCVHQKIIMLS